jgi:excisionase family DNA binding protein
MNLIASLLTADELAAALRVSSRTVDRLVAEGLPRVRVRLRLYRYDLAEVRAWCERRAGQEEAGRALH